MITTLSCTSTDFMELGSEFLRLGKSIRFQAHGNSMQPLVRDGDILLLEPVLQKKVKVGDIILCAPQPDVVVVHRVIRRKTKSNKTSFLVQGDHVGRPDGWISSQKIYGRAVKIERDPNSIDINFPVMRILGWMALIRSRWTFNRSGFYRKASQMVKRLPGFVTYLT